MYQWLKLYIKDSFLLKRLSSKGSMMSFTYRYSRYHYTMSQRKRRDFLSRYIGKL